MKEVIIFWGLVLIMATWGIKNGIDANTILDSIESLRVECIEK